MVSIITPAYNGEEYIAETINSVLAQTYTNWEMLIIDDCSTDRTIEVVKGFGDSRIHFIQNSTNSGAAIARNKALAEAKGKWIAFLDSDDLWYPEKLEKQIEFMKQNNYNFTYTEYLVMDERDGTRAIKMSGPKRITKKDMYNCNWIGCLTVMYNREVVGTLKIPDLKKRNDYALWLKAIHSSDCYLYPHVLAKYRKHANSISNVSKLSLLYHHYLLHRYSERRTKLMSFINTLRNGFWSSYRKKIYSKKL